MQEWETDLHLTNTAHHSVQEEEDMKKKITQNERLQLTGLMALAKEHYQMLRACEKSMANIIGVELNDLGHLADEIYGLETYNVDEALKSMEIEVVKD